MATIDQETHRSQCDCCSGMTEVHGLELDDGTYLPNYGVELQVDEGTPFNLELLPDPYGPETDEYDVFGEGELTEVTPTKIQKWYDEGRLRIMEK